MTHDSDLADRGADRMAYGARSMPGLGSIAREWAESTPLAGQRIAASLHVTVETAALCSALVAGGAEVTLCASSPFSTQNDIAAVLERDLGVRVFAAYGADDATFAAHQRAAASSRPTIIVDDGGQLTEEYHRDASLASAVIGGTEITSSGVARIRALAAAGTLQYPVFSIDDSSIKQIFDNRHGTGQTTIDGILRATNALIAGSVFVVAGYGWVGRGIAERARGLGADVVVTEADPVRALEARFSGYRVLPMARALAEADIVVTATGVAGVVMADDLRGVRSGILIANAGHFADEIDVAGLREAAVSTREVREHVECFELADGREVLLIAGGGPVGLAVGEANPAAVMDLTFSTQALTIEHLVRTTALPDAAPLAAAIHRVPESVERGVARYALAARGIEID